MKVYIAKEAAIGVCENGAVSWYESQYIKKYLQNAEQIQRRNEWKLSGTGAAFRGDEIKMQRAGITEKKDYSISALSQIARDELIYVANIENSSAILIKKMDGSQSTEGHLVHDTDRFFSGVCYNRKQNRGVFSVQHKAIEKRLALFDNRESRYREITEGDCLDENAFWNPLKDDELYYNSIPVGRDYGGNFSAYGSSTINRFDLSNGEIEEVVSLANHDCLLPKLDALGNLYYLKRPSGYAAGRGNPLTDIIDIFLIPFRLLRAIYSYFNFFAIRFTGTPLRSRDGVNVKSRELDEKTVFINGNIIHAQKNLQRNRRSGDKYPGIAPRNWELMRRDASGKTVCLRRGVLDYDVSAQGEIVFSNGKYLIKINKDMSEEVLLKADLVTKIAIENLD